MAERNVTYSVKGNKLTIVVDISPNSCAAAPPSMSGKTNIIGTTGGYASVSPSTAGYAVQYSVNVICKPN